MLALSFLLFAQAAAIPSVEGPAAELAAIRYIDVAKGSGRAAESGRKFRVHYTGWLRDGTKFDSSVDRNEPFEFVQGRRLVIAGWEAGFEGMKVGGKRRLFIPYQFAYGEKGRDPIPPKAELVFDVELLEVTDVPEVLAAADLLLPLSDLEAKVLALAKAVPEAKYAWKPSEGARSFGQVLLHIALANKLLLDVAEEGLSATALQQRIEANVRSEKEPLTQTRLLHLLTDSFAAVRKAMEAARPGTLARDVSFFGRTMSERAVLTFLETHLAEHTGQAIAYARMNGIVPPWSNNATGPGL